MSYAYYPSSLLRSRARKEFVRQYLKNWRWTTFGSLSLATEEVLKGNHTAVFAQQRRHKYYCLYEWRILIRAMAYRRPLEEKLDIFGRINHCSKTLLEVEEESDAVPSLQVRSLLAKCGVSAEEMEEESCHL